MFTAEALQYLATSIVENGFDLPDWIFVQYSTLAPRNPNLPQQTKTKLLDINAARFSEEGILLVNPGPTEGVTLLTLTIKHCPRFILELLPKFGQYRATANNVGSDPLILYAIRCWHEETTQARLNYIKADLRLKVISALANLGLNLVKPNLETGETPLTTAVRGRYSEVVNILTCYPKVREQLEQVYNGRTLLIEAVINYSNSYESRATIDSLLTAGADTRAQDEATGNTALHSAIIRQDLPLVKSFLMRSCVTDPTLQLTVTNREGISPLWMAFEIAHRTNTDVSLQILEALAMTGANLAEQRENETPLILAIRAQKQNIKLIDLLLKYGGVQLFTQGVNGITPLQLAIQAASDTETAKHKAIVTLLMNAITLNLNLERESPEALKNLLDLLCAAIIFKPTDDDTKHLLTATIIKNLPNASPEQLVDIIMYRETLGLQSDYLKAELIFALKRCTPDMSPSTIARAFEYLGKFGLQGDAGLEVELIMSLTNKAHLLNRFELAQACRGLVKFTSQDPQLNAAIATAFITHAATMSDLERIHTAHIIEPLATRTKDRNLDRAIDILSEERDPTTQAPAAKRARGSCNPNTPCIQKKPEDDRDPDGSSDGTRPPSSLPPTQAINPESGGSRSGGDSTSGGGGSVGKQAVLKLYTSTNEKAFNEGFDMWASIVSSLESILNSENKDYLIKIASEALNGLVLVEGKGNVFLPGHPSPNPDPDGGSSGGRDEEPVNKNPGNSFALAGNVTEMSYYTSLAGENTAHQSNLVAAAA